jgi:lantibiotic modifying enzyme
MADAAWEPLFLGEEARPVWSVIDRIAAAIAAPIVSRPDVGAGLAGLALFFDALAVASGDARHRATAEGILERSFEGAHDNADPGLFTGFPGVVFAADILHPPGDDDAHDAIDEVIADVCGTSPWRGEYDLILGLTGLGTYGVARHPRPTGTRVVELVIERLAELAVIAEGDDGPRAFWHNPPQSGANARFPADSANLGLAHGHAGVVALLAEVCAARIAPAKARPLLDAAVRWFLAHEDPAFGFAAYAVEGAAAPRTRSAWCYGNPGAGVALLAAARAANDAAWEARALALLERETKLPKGESRVVDGGLCHGSAGLAHLYNRVYQATRHDDFRAAARRWAEDALAMARPDAGVAGYQAYMPIGGGSMQWADEPGLLMGVAGIGLALLATVAPVVPMWDRLLLTALPVARAAGVQP